MNKISRKLRAILSWTLTSFGAFLGCFILWDFATIDGTTCRKLKEENEFLPSPILNEVAITDSINTDFHYDHSTAFEFFSLFYQPQDFDWDAAWAALRRNKHDENKTAALLSQIPKVYFGETFKTFDLSGTMTGFLNLTSTTIVLNTDKPSWKLLPGKLPTYDQDQPVYGVVSVSPQDFNTSLDEGVFCLETITSKGKKEIQGYWYGRDARPENARDFCNTTNELVQSLHRPGHLLRPHDTPMSSALPPLGKSFSRSGLGLRFMDFKWKVLRATIGEPNVRQRTPMCGGRFLCQEENKLFPSIWTSRYWIHRKKFIFFGPCMQTCQRIYMPRLSVILLGWSCGKCPENN